MPSGSYFRVALLRDRTYKHVVLSPDVTLSNLQADSGTQHKQDRATHVYVIVKQNSHQRTEKSNASLAFVTLILSVGSNNQ